MPGVVMLEAVAQVCCYCAHKYDLLGTTMVGFGGLKSSLPRSSLTRRPIVVMCELLKARRNRIIVCRFQGFVGTNLVLEGILKGIPIPVESLASLHEQRTQKN